MPNRRRDDDGQLGAARLVHRVDHRLQFGFVVEQSVEPVPPLRQVGREPGAGRRRAGLSSRLSAGARGSTVDDVVEPALDDGRDTFGLTGEVVREGAPGDPDRVGDVGDRHGRVAARRRPDPSRPRRAPAGSRPSSAPADRLARRPHRRPFARPRWAQSCPPPLSQHSCHDCRPQFAHCAIFPSWQPMCFPSDTLDRRAAARRIPLPRAYSDSGFRPGAPSVRVRGGSTMKFNPNARLDTSQVQDRRSGGGGGGSRRRPRPVCPAARAAWPSAAADSVC